MAPRALETSLGPVHCCPIADAGQFADHLASDLLHLCDRVRLPPCCWGSRPCRDRNGCPDSSKLITASTMLKPVPITNTGSAPCVNASNCQGPADTSLRHREPRTQRRQIGRPILAAPKTVGSTRASQSAFKVRRSIQALALRLASSRVVASRKPGSARVCRTRHRVTLKGL